MKNKKSFRKTSEDFFGFHLTLKKTLPDLLNRLFGLLQNAGVFPN